LEALRNNAIENEQYSPPSEHVTHLEKVNEPH
jgi:hypothetical protein